MPTIREQIRTTIIGLAGLLNKINILQCFDNEEHQEQIIE